jgi:hypothetical protein
VCSQSTLFYVVFSHVWTFESVKGRQGYLCYINKTIDDQPFSRLGDGVVNIMGSMCNQNLSIMLPPHLNPYFIWILYVIWWVFMLSVKKFQVEVEGMACLINIFSLKTYNPFCKTYVDSWMSFKKSIPLATYWNTISIQHEFGLYNFNYLQFELLKGDG